MIPYLRALHRLYALAVARGAIARLWAECLDLLARIGCGIVGVAFALVLAAAILVVIVAVVLTGGFGPDTAWADEDFEP